MLKTLLGALLLSVLLAHAADDPAALYHKAKEKRKQATEYSNCITLLTKANDLWKKAGSTDLDYARSLDLLTVLLLSRALSPDPKEIDSPTNREAWRQVVPLTRRALDIVRANQNVAPDDKALALEVEADALGRSSMEGAPLWQQASAIRKALVAQIGSSASQSTSSELLNSIASPNDPGVLAPRIISRDPVTIEKGVLLVHEGRVLLKIVISKDGVPQDFELAEGLGYGFDEAAVHTVSAWRFKPGTKDGQPIDVRAQIEVKFKISPADLIH